MHTKIHGCEVGVKNSYTNWFLCSQFLLSFYYLYFDMKPQALLLINTMYNDHHNERANKKDE